MIAAHGSRSAFALVAFMVVELATARLFAAEVNLLAFGDWGATNSTAQRATAVRMATYAAKNSVRFDAALLLGDNFYGKLPRGVADPRWRTEFEEMYDAVTLPMPFYVALGNHDYEPGKAAAELAYAKQHPESRWKMPAKWYRVEIPADHPLVSVLVLDSNFTDLRGAWKTELAWLESELARPRPGRWLIAIAHHPVFSNSNHGDTKELIRDWEPLFRRHKLDFFICGHDHCVQHLEVAGHPTSFIVSGGGGAKRYPMRRDDRGPFAKSENGFLHLTLGPDLAAGKVISSNGEILHEFTKDAAGHVAVAKTTGIEKKALLPKGKAAKNED